MSITHTAFNQLSAFRTRMLLAAVLTAGAISGAVAGALLFSPGVVNAQNGGSGSGGEGGAAGSDGADSGSDGSAEAREGGAAAGKSANGKSAKTLGKRMFGKHLGKHHHRHAQADELAELVGISPEQAIEAIKSGKSWADIAVEHDVDPQVLIDAIVSRVGEQVTAKVADGLIDQDRADGMLADMESKAAAFVNGEHEAKGRYCEGRHGDGHAFGKSRGARNSKSGTGWATAAARDGSGPQNAMAA